MTENVPAEDGERPAEEPGQGVIAAFGRQLKLLRVRAGVSREELGEQVGYSAISSAATTRDAQATVSPDRANSGRFAIKGDTGP